MANAPILSRTVDYSHQGGNLQIIFVATLEKINQSFGSTLNLKALS